MRYRGLSDLVVSIAVLLGVSACGTTQLQVQRLPTAGPSSTSSTGTPPTAVAPGGLVYFLPYLEVDLEYKRRITLCDPNLARWLKAELENLQLIYEQLESQAGNPLPEAAFRNILGDAFKPMKPLLRERGLEETAALSLSKEEVSSIIRESIPIFLREGLEEYRHALPEGFLTRLEEGGAAETLLENLITLVKPDLDKALYDVKFAHTVTAKPRYLPDNDHAYWVDHQAMTDGFKKTDLTIETYANGAIKSINGEIEDQTGAVITSTLQGVLRLASAVGGIPTPPSGQPESAVPQDPEPIVPLCQADIYRKIQQRRALTAAINPTAQKILQQEGVVKRSTSALATSKKKRDEAKATKAKLEAEGVGPSDQRWQKAKAEIDEAEEEIKKREKEITEANKKIKDLESEIAGKRRQITALDKDLTHSIVLTFRPTETLRQEELRGADKASDRWFEPEGRKRYCEGTDKPCTAADASGVPNRLLAWAAIYLAPGTPTYSATHTQVNTGGHFVYREPAIGRLLVCKTEACLKGFQMAAHREDRLLDDKIEVPQLGVLTTLPLLNKGFQNNNLEAKFSESGHLTKLEYHSNARFKAAAETFNASTESLGAYIEARREADKAALDRKTAEVEAERDRVKAQLELEQARRCLEAFQAGETLDGCDGSDSE
jgi:hypothetical protein